MLDRLAGFLDEAPAGHQYALEIRNPRRLNEAQFRFIADRGVVPVLLQGYWMPPVWEIHRDWRELLIRAGTVLIRLHGPDREGMERDTDNHWDRLVVQRDDELREICGMVQDLLDAGVDVYLNVNNHYEGCAPLTIERVRTMLGMGSDVSPFPGTGGPGAPTLPGLE